jgi:hypothetical protein
LVQNFSRIKVYNVLAVPILLYGSEIWALRRKGKQKNIDINRDGIFQNSRVYIPFVTAKRMKKFLEEFESRTS